MWVVYLNVLPNLLLLDEDILINVSLCRMNLKFSFQILIMMLLKKKRKTKSELTRQWFEPGRITAYLASAEGHK